jgi:AcrR family transcriptional regulator
VADPSAGGQPQAHRRGRRRDPRAHQAIIDATLEILATQGYARLTIESIATRAGVAKTTIYRRWSSKGPLVTEAISTQVHLARVPDTGDTRADLSTFLRAVIGVLQAPLIAQTLPGLAVEVGGNPELANALSHHIVAPKRARVTEILDRAVARGELRPDLDYELVLDMLVGPIMWSAMVTGASLDDDFAERLADRVVRGIELAPGQSLDGGAGT